MAASGYIYFQYTLISAISILLTVLVLLGCGFCKRFKKRRSHYLNGTTGNVTREPTQLNKHTPRQDVFTVNERKTMAGIDNASFTPGESEGQASMKTEINGDVIQSQAKQAQAGQKLDANGSADPQGRPVQDTKFSLKHRRLPSVPQMAGDNILIHQPSSKQNSQGEPPAYEELIVKKADVEVRPSGGAVKGLFSEDLSGHAHAEEELEWPPIPHVTFLNRFAENIYSDVDNLCIPSDQGMISEGPAITDEDTQQALPSVRTPGEGMEALTPTSMPTDLSWRFHSPLENGTENVTNINEKEIHDLYSKVKKNLKHSNAVPPPSLEAFTVQDDDLPPPVPIKRFNIEDILDFEEPLPPPPPPILEMD